jgi:hypothetical protein
MSAVREDTSVGVEGKQAAKIEAVLITHVLDHKTYDKNNRKTEI